jgi:glycosyltransferase involved in cell wall biosynthesis
MPLRYASAAWQVFCKTLTRRFDLVHGHFGLWALTARLQWTTPVVVSFLGDDLLGRPKPGGYTRKSLLVVRVSRWLARHVDGVIVKSAQMRKVIDPDVAVAIIPNGVDFTLFRPLPRVEMRTELGWSLNGFYILFGNDPTLYRKGFSLAQEALSCLKQRGVEAELVIANGLPQTQLVQYLNACNALILPSLIEGSPNIVKEAMACNIPVVSSDVGDVAQLIGHTAGCSVCPRTPEAFADALERAWLHQEPTTGRHDIAHLENSVVAQQVIAVYQRALAKTKRMKGRS